jgi:uncharacterized protein YkwD
MRLLIISLLVLTTLTAKGQLLDSKPIFDEINAYRKFMGGYGVQQVTYDSTIQKELDAFCKTLPTKFEHEYKHNCYEVIAMGPSFKDIVKQWKDSPPHDDIIRERDVRSGAVSVYKEGDYYYAVFRSMSK